MLSVFSAPSRYTQGPDATKSLGAEMKALGLPGPALILAGGSAVAQLSGIWRAAFGDSGIAHTVEPFGGECSHREIERVKAVAQASSAGTIVGAGGGKVLDTARAVAAELDLPVVNCPTVASSDAPCSALSVLYDDNHAVVDFRIYGRNPDLVLVDTTVIANAPPRLLAAGMGDALATVFEARTCVEGRVRNMRGGASTQSALALAELCYRTLLEDGRTAMDAASNRAVSPALERLVEANTLLSGLGFESSGLAAAHSVHNGLTAVSGTQPYYHGEKVAFGTLTQLVLEGKPTALIEEVLGFSTSVGLPVTLEGVGLPGCSEPDLDRISKRAVAPGETIHNEPFEVTPRAVRHAILAADAIGRRWKLDRGR